MTTKERKPIDWESTVNRPDAELLTEIRRRDGTFRGYDGFVAAPYGYARVIYEEYSDGTSKLEMSVIRDGALHGRHYKGPYHRRTIIALATRFAKEIAERMQP